MTVADRCERGHLISEEGRNARNRCRGCVREEARGWREKNRAKGREEGRLMLPAEPFARWLRDNTNGAESMRVYARVYGLSETRLRRLLGGRQRFIHIDTVDRIAGPVVLNELYPVGEPVAA